MRKVPPLALAALRKCGKVLDSLWRQVAVEAKHDTASSLAAMLNVEEHLLSDLRLLVRQRKCSRRNSEERNKESHEAHSVHGG